MINVDIRNKIEAYKEMVQFHATTICARSDGPDDVCIGGDGQVTMGEHTIMKNGAKKVRKIYKNTVVTGFAGSVADAFALTEKFEKKLEEHGGNLKKRRSIWRRSGVPIRVCAAWRR